MREIRNPHHQPRGNFEIESIKNRPVNEQTELIAQHFAHVSQSYEPFSHQKLPAYLPAPKPPQVTELEIFEKMKN